MRGIRGLRFVSALALLALAGCGREGIVVTEPATPTPTPYIAPTEAPVESVSPSPSASPTASLEASPSATVLGISITPAPTPTPTPTARPAHTTAPTPHSTQPPDSFVRSKAGEVKGTLGSYCWTSYTSTCKSVDKPHGKPKSGLRIARGERVILRYAIDASPTDIRIELRQNSETKETPFVNAANPTIFGTHADPGLYWVVITARWAQGATTHVFAVDVR